MTSAPDPGFPLEHLLTDLDVVEVRRSPDVHLTSVVQDSRLVSPGALFACVRGLNVDGHEHAAEAVAAGAVALLCERPLDLPVTQVVVRDVRRQVGRAAAALHHHPSRSMTVIGVTGTDGKTTTVQMIDAVMRAAGRQPGSIGTLNPVPGGPPNTPDAPHLQARLAELRQSGCDVVAMEVSSHALALDRVSGTRFAAAVFTNLSQDHLDFHGTIDSYFEAKARLFEPELSLEAVINADDPYGKELLARVPIPAEPFSLADAADLRSGLHGSTFSWRGTRVHLGMGGLHNVSNALAAATAAARVGVDAEAVAAGLAAVRTPGRFETIDAGQQFTLIVDYAHTPGGLDHLLRAVRPAGDARVIAVFGCGGDKDRDKRPKMGRIAGELADLVVITSDNPRGEDPGRIIEEVRAGVAGPARIVVEPDRRSAIVTAVRSAGPGDVVVVAGKGHETTQTIGDQVIPFDDRTVAREELERLVGGGGTAA